MGDPGSISGSWRSPGERNPGWLQSLGLQRVGHDWATSFSFFLSSQWQGGPALWLQFIEDSTTSKVLGLLSDPVADVLVQALITSCWMMAIVSWHLFVFTSWGAARIIFSKFKLDHVISLLNPSVCLSRILWTDLFFFFPCFQSFPEILDSLIPGFVVVQSHSLVWLFVNPWTAAHKASLSLTISQSSCSLHQWCRPAILSSDDLFSFGPQSFPGSGTFPMSCLFTSDDWNIGASALVLPVNTQGWSPVRLTGLISLPSKVLSGVFFSTTVLRHQFFGVLPSIQSSSHNHMWPLGRPLPWLYRLLPTE